MFVDSFERNTIISYVGTDGKATCFWSITAKLVLYRRGVQSSVTRRNIIVFIAILTYLTLKLIEVIYLFCGFLYTHYFFFLYVFKQ